jgi:hypothetical protein
MTIENMWTNIFEDVRTSGHYSCEAVNDSDDVEKSGMLYLKVEG